ncbi:MAG TPA: DUF2141 domain-containing protein [Flammeovirgaceae bacterium]|nr:DUF2141 domain-containing protein [Flammeovirgaceae bacterium]
MKTLINLTALLLAALYALPVSAQDDYKIVVEVENIQSTEGSIRVGLFNSKKTFLEDAYKGITARPQKGTMTFTFEHIPPGEYTVSVYHDLNDNGELDSNMMGIPTEPYGISLEGRSMFGPPVYSRAAFKVTDKNVKLLITLE